MGGGSAGASSGLMVGKIVSLDCVEGVVELRRFMPRGRGT